MDHLEFRRVIVETYHKNYTTKMSPSTIFPKSLKYHVRMVEENHHWIRIKNQRRCAKKGCNGTSVFFCTKCNVGLHPECFEKFHFQ